MTKIIKHAIYILLPVVAAAIVSLFIFDYSARYIVMSSIALNILLALVNSLLAASKSGSGEDTYRLFATTAMLTILLNTITAPNLYFGRLSIMYVAAVLSNISSTVITFNVAFKFIDTKGELE